MVVQGSPTRRLAAVLAADVVEYSRMMSEDEASTLDSWWKSRREVIDPAIERRQGRIVKHTGDGFLAEFTNALDAVNCAIEIQDLLAQRNVGSKRSQRMDFRMGVNICDVIDDGEDIYGDGVNIAARLEGLAEPGGICISGDVYRQVRSNIHLGYRSLGEQKVKNIAEPVVAYLIGPQDFSNAQNSRIFQRPWSRKPSPKRSSPDSGIDAVDVSPERLRLTAIILCVLVGLFGGHRFYLGLTRTAYVQLFTLGGLGLWMLADLVLLITGELRDGEGRRTMWVRRK